MGLKDLLRDHVIAGNSEIIPIVSASVIDDAVDGDRPVEVNRHGQSLVSTLFAMVEMVQGAGLLFARKPIGDPPANFPRSACQRDYPAGCAGDAAMIC